MIYGRIDTHAHLLPGVDDGCATIDESVACARALIGAGYTHAFCTPHVWPNLRDNTAANIGAWVAALQRGYDARGVPLRLLPGGELNLLQDQSALDAQVVTFGLAGKYALFDFWADEWADCRPRLSAAVQRLQSLGMRLILAHPERIAALQRDPAAIDWFTDRGVLLQMNTWCLTKARSSPIYATAARLLAEDRYFCFGTDTHDPAGMPDRIQGVAIAEELVGPERVRRLMVDHPRLLMPDPSESPQPSWVVGQFR